MEPESQESLSSPPAGGEAEVNGVVENNTPQTSTPSFGWNNYAEKLNGRFAMIGFVALLLLEFITRQDFFTWLGF